jgi:hypothetical protein
MSSRNCEFEIREELLGWVLSEQYAANCAMTSPMA